MVTAPRFLPAAEYVARMAEARAEGRRIVREGLAEVDTRNLPALDKAPCPFAWPCPFCGES